MRILARLQARFVENLVDTHEVVGNVLPCELGCHVVPCELECNVVPCELECNVVPCELEGHVVPCELGCHVVPCELELQKKPQCTKQLPQSSPLVLIICSVSFPVFNTFSLLIQIKLLNK